MNAVPTEPHRSVLNRCRGHVLFYARAVSYFRADALLIVLLLLLIALSVGLGLLQAWPTAVLVDSVLTSQPRGDWVHRLFLSPLPSNRLGQVIGITLIGMALKLVQDVIGLAREMLRRKVAYAGTTRVRHALYTKLQRLSMGYHRSRPQGDAIFRVTTDAWGPRDVFDVTLDSAVAAATLLAMTGIMLSRTVPLTIFSLSVAPALLLCNLYFGKRIRRRQLLAKERDTEFTTSVQRSVSSANLVRAFGRQDHEAGRFAHSVTECVGAMLRLDWQTLLAGCATQTIFSFGGALVFGYGGYLVYRDQFLHPKLNGVTCGDLMVFMAYLGQMWSPLNTLTGFVAAVQKGAAGAQRVFEVLDHADEIVDAPGAEHIDRRPRSLVLQDVQFEYSPEQTVLRGISAVIRPGEMVAFVGPSGAGKSTLLSLFPRFADPTGGALRLDGRDIRKIRLEDVRSQMSLVLQDALVLPATIAENIAYGNPHATALEIRRAAELAGAGAFINELENGYDTQISEGGQNLSGGQRQRLAIARALLSPAPILILDEPTAALDSASERQVLNSLLNLRGSRTVILVTHSLAAAAHCERVFVMDRGAIVERGTPAELLAKNGVYARLASTQSAGTYPVAA